MNFWGVCKQKYSDIRFWLQIREFDKDMDNLFKKEDSQK